MIKCSLNNQKTCLVVMIPIVTLLLYEGVRYVKTPTFKSATNVHYIDKVPQTEEKVRSWKAGLQKITPGPTTTPKLIAEEGPPLPVQESRGPEYAEDPYWKDIYPAHWVHANGTFTERIAYYNVEIAKLRKKLLTDRGNATWQDVFPQLTVFWCNRDDALGALRDFPIVQTVALAWSPFPPRIKQWSSLEDTQNLLLQKFYPWSGSRSMCYLIGTPGFTKARWDAVYGRRCSIDLNATATPISLEPLYFYGKPINNRDYWPNNGFWYPSYFYHSLPPQVFYMHILQDVVITGLGDVISGHLKLLPYSCSQDVDPRPPKGYTNTSLYEEVFIVTQYWGEAFFHKMIEGFPRIAPYVSFLKEHPNIKIHVAETEGYTEKIMILLGFDPSRLVTGVCRAEIVYLPQGTPCGFAQPQSTQLLSQMYQEIIKDKHGVQERNSVVLIIRTGSRRMLEVKAVKQKLEDLSAEFGRRFEEFPDNPVPPMEEAMQMFNRAVLVVAPHGAGLSNLIYSLPGTYVVEAVCNPPHVNMCFQWMAHVLGHHYHAIPSRGGCESYIRVSPDEVIHAARSFLHHAKQTLQS